MTIATPPAARAAPPAIARDRYHRYTHEGVRHPGVTGIIRVLDKSDALIGWASRNTAEAALRLIDSLPELRATVGPEGVVKALTARSGWQRDEAAAAGSTIHGHAERIANGGDLPDDLPDAVRERVLRYAEWWAASGWRVRLAEALVVDPGVGYGGTLDLLAYDEAGRVTLADVKSGKSVYPETRLQLAAYGMAALVAPQGSPVAYPMPAVERYAVLHVTDEGVRVIDVDVDDADRDAFRACVALSGWHAARKGWRP
jgi:hypothetical protein